MADPLFAEYALSELLDVRKGEMLNEIKTYPSDQLLNSSADDLAEYFAEKYTLSPIVIDEDAIHVSQRESKADARYLPDRHVWDRGSPVEVPAVQVTLHVPFSGYEDLFRCTTVLPSNPPRGSVVQGLLQLKITTTTHDPDAVRREFDGRLNSIRQEIQTLTKEVVPWNEALVGFARDAIETRRDRLLKDQGLVAQLGFPMERRDGDSTYSAPEVRRKPPVQPPPAMTGAYKAEPALDSAVYEHILEVISSTAVALERSPQTFARMGEEELRDQFLVPLNTHYEGQATGETFNAHGKTDILIRAGDRSIFIAECKIWRGASSFTEAIDQLLSYTTWRDTKTALLVFNRNKDFTAVLEKVPGLLADHPQFKRTRTFEHESGFRVVLASPSDSAREITLTVLLFDVPS